ncbi:hypothetical protein [Acinetobacter bereziniae]|uniref:hypothetical protein n=1 Tax=Acinetobacter bereziniae TaxID=106648 RepID=UPI0005739864|nr:hypothetical protein [Acinetobacter bereziniae]MBO3655971.1 hypothetical protein [Acinetobacter bereziniae]MDA3442657.1 hypothetical protein [Acinetobacter bereziniae]CEI50780.1 hypothetical protein [Acinetobacter bereziniae]
MDFCNYNWDLISRFVPLVTPTVSIGIAFFVYKVWHIQKGKEVIAQEAKSIIESIYELNKVFFDLQNYNFEDFEDMKLKMKKFKSERDNLTLKLTFIRNSLDNKIKFNQIIDKFDNECKKITNILNKYLEIKPKLDIEDFYLEIEIKNPLSQLAPHPLLDSELEILESCKNLAMYRDIS